MKNTAMTILMCLAGCAFEDASEPPGMEEPVPVEQPEPAAPEPELPVCIHREAGEWQAPGVVTQVWVGRRLVQQKSRYVSLSEHDFEVLPDGLTALNPNGDEAWSIPAERGVQSVWSENGEGWVHIASEERSAVAQLSEDGEINIVRAFTRETDGFLPDWVRLSADGHEGWALEGSQLLRIEGDSTQVIAWPAEWRNERRAPKVRDGRLYVLNRSDDGGLSLGTVSPGGDWQMAPLPPLPDWQVRDMSVTADGVAVLMAEFSTDHPEAPTHVRYTGGILHRFDLEFVAAEPLRLDVQEGCLSTALSLAEHPDGILIGSAVSCGGWGSESIDLRIAHSDGALEPIGSYGLNQVDLVGAITVAPDGHVAVRAEYMADLIYSASFPYWFIMPPGGCRLEPAADAVER